MATGGCEKDSGKRYQHDIARVSGMIADHGDQRDDRSQHRPGCALHGLRHACGEEAGAFRHPCAQHDHEDIAQGMKVGERCRHFDPEALDILGRKQAYRLDPLRISSDLVERSGMHCRDAGHRRNDREKYQGNYQIEENEDWIGQLVACPFDPSQNAGLGRYCLRSCFRHRISLNIIFVGWMIMIILSDTVLNRWCRKG